MADTTIYKDLGLVNTKEMFRKVLAENPSEFDPRKYLGPAREELIKMVALKNEKVLGSAGKA